MPGERGMFIDKAGSIEMKGIYIRLIQPRCPRDGWQAPSLLAAYLGRVISPLITHCCSALLSIIIIIAIVNIIAIPHICHFLHRQNFWGIKFTQ